MGKDDKIYKILIVDSSEDDRVVLRHVLEKENWQVVCSQGAEEAIELLSKPMEEELPDLIIIDFHLPGIRGDELCRRLKLHITTRSIPTLILAKKVDESEEDLAALKKCSSDDYLPKYSEEEILLSRIRALLRKSKKSHILLGIGSPFFQRSRILAADDSPDFLAFLYEAFKEDGIIIEKALSSREALYKISRKKYDCLVVGQLESETDGIEICKKILEMRRMMEESILILMLMTHETKENMTRALEAGADDFVGKVSDIAIIKARLISLLRRKFIQEDNQRIFEELKRKELEVERSRIEKVAAETKAILAEKLLITVEQLEDEIEERKRMEKKIKNYSLELERSNKELEAFAYVASHDLQEPLRAISSYLQLVEKRYKDKIDEKGKDFINRAVNGARRMQDMINDLLIYSRITTRAKTFAPCSLESIVDRALTNLSASIERSQATITRTPMPELICDEAQILRLFQNILSNAIKFCENSLPVIHISAEQENPEELWLFSIKDNGIGIEPEHKDNIFKIFNRLHSRGKYPGTGIGLAICQKIVERHGGRIWADSTPGEGSIFYFTLGKMDSDMDGES